MTSFLSPVEKINRLVFNPIPTGRPVALDKMLRVSGFVVIVDAKGKLYSPNLKDRVCYSCETWPWSDSLLRALVKLGVITSEEMDAHLKRAKEIDNLRSRRNAAKELKRYANRLGMKLTASQEKALTRSTQ